MTRALARGGGEVLDSREKEERYKVTRLYEVLDYSREKQGLEPPNPDQDAPFPLSLEASQAVRKPISLSCVFF